MHRSICLILAMVLSAGPLAQVSFGFKNPLKEYNLYEEVHSSDRAANPDRETVMGDMFYSQNGLNKKDGGSKNNSKKGRKSAPSANPTSEDKGFNEELQDIEVEIPQRRNDYLRESSKKVYSPEGTPRWTEGESFYEKPSLESIKEKYRQSNFAGCMQECEAYVRLNPNDTLGFYYLAMSYAKADDKDNAVRAYEKVISLNANPMIVKYATNGRNCILKGMNTKTDEDEIKCFENVNEPEYLYPYKDMAKTIDMTPVDPQTLINKNIQELQNKIAPTESSKSDDKDDKSKIKLPFGSQDSALDAFIKAPYGTGMSSELEKQYKQIQLREFQQNLNNGNNIEKIPDKKLKNDKKSESEMIKLAMAEGDDIKDLFNSPEFIQNKREMDQIKMMFGDYKSEKGNDLMDIIPALSQGDEKLSPQAVQALMMQSVMPDIINIDGHNAF